MQTAASVNEGSKRTCGGAAAGSQRFRSSSQPLDDRSQPFRDIDTNSRSELIACSNGCYALYCALQSPGTIQPARMRGEGADHIVTEGGTL